MIDRNEILLVDDDDINNFYAKDLLEELKRFSKIIIFSDPLEALDFLKTRIAQQEKVPAFLLIDVKMPVMDGFELLDEIDDLLDGHKELPSAFILTSSTHKRDIEQFKRSQLAVKYLNKPINIEEVSLLFT